MTGLVARASAVVALALVAVPASARPSEKLLHSYASVTIAPNGTHVAAIESEEAPVLGGPVTQQLVIRPTAGGAARVVAFPCAGGTRCRPSEPQWSPDGKTLVFVVTAPKLERRELYAVDANGGNPRRLLDFAGTLGAPRFAPNGELAVLATAGAHKETGATQAGAPQVGLIGSTDDEQRIGIVDAAKNALIWASPPDLFVYQYDWKPDAAGFVGTAAAGNGDDDWWIAKLYVFDAHAGTATVLYAPSSPAQQLADPRVSPDGTLVAFIGGIMSDFGSTGGDAYTIPIAGGKATDETPKMHASATSVFWECPKDPDRDHLSFTALDGSQTQIREAWPLVASAQEHLGYSFGDATASDLSIACNARGIDDAFVRQSFAEPPEIFVATNFGNVHPMTNQNDGMAPATQPQSVTWRDGDFDVQGWLLAPVTSDPKVKHPMITFIHGGPSAATTPRFVGRGAQRDLLNAGYYLFYPNPRGSFGQGEAFTVANVRDFGYGDLRDDLAGIDAVEKVAPVDDARLGIAGGSYGGFMTMWAVTQTKRFKAAVAQAGVSDWISYYGENGIDRWMIPFFGASAYDDPAIYRRSSPIDFIKNATTPTLEYVGQLDIECPAPQSIEFWHALETLGVPTQLVIYPGEGHHLRDPADIADASKRTVDWFDRYLKS